MHLWICSLHCPHHMTVSECGISSIIIWCCLIYCNYFSDYLFPAFWGGISCHTIQEFHNYPHKVFYGWCQFLCKFCPRRLPCHFFYKRSLKLLSLLENFTLEVIKYKYIAADCLRLSTVNNAALCPKYSVNLSLKQVKKKKKTERERNGTHIKSRLTMCWKII